MFPPLEEPSARNSPAIGGCLARGTLLFALVALLPGSVMGQEPDPPGEEGSTQEEVGYPIHGSSSTRYRGRFSDDDDDSDVYQTLYLYFGDAERDRFTFHLSGLATYDLDGEADPDDEFFNTTDTYDSQLHGRLYEAYADVHRIDAVESLRLGRQMTYETPEFIWFDGGSLETKAKGKKHISLGLYGGVPVHVYESSPAGDALYGAYGKGRPWTGGRVRVDWLRLQDDNLLGDHDNDLLGLEVWQGLTDRVNFWGSFTRLDNENRDYHVRGTYMDLESEFTLQASFRELLETQKDLALEVDPFYDSLREYYPYRQAQVVSSKGLGDDVTLQAGADIRRVTDDDDIGEFNRDFERYYLTGVVQDAFVDGLELSLTGDIWESDDNDTRSWGFNAAKDLSERLKASLGTYYSLYKYDVFLDDEEKDDVRTYYLRLKFKRTSNLSFDFRYEFEHGEFDDQHGLRLGITRRF